MTKFDVGKVVFETTRKCNMSCPHCLRGEQQDKEITKEVIDLTLDHVYQIHEIRFDGGEPSLNPESMMYTLESCKKRQIPVYGFYLETNGKEVTDAFVEAIFAWYRYFLHCNLADPVSRRSNCEDLMLSGYDLKKLINYMTVDRFYDPIVDRFAIALSVDKYHEGIPYRNAIRLANLPGFSTSSIVDSSQHYVINEGRAKKLGADQKKVEKALVDDFLLFKWENDACPHTLDMAYVNVDGCIFGDGKLSYDHQADGSVPCYSVFEPDWAERMVAEHKELDEDEFYEEELDGLRRKEFYAYILENFTVSRQERPLIDHVLRFVGKNYHTKEEQYLAVDNLLHEWHWKRRETK